MSYDFQKLYRKLDYTFQDPMLLKQALTHCSVAGPHNERLEFLGDSLLSTVIAHALFKQCPDHKEGELSRLRASLVKGDMLASLAQELDIGAHLFLGQGELKSGGFRRASILADALEAIFAAIYLDSGFDACQHVILHIYQNRLNNIHSETNTKDPKTTLQEYVQREKYPLPEYHLDQVIGEEHEQRFFVSCRVLEFKTHGDAETRRKAEQQSAQKLLNILMEQPTKAQKRRPRD